MQKFLLTTAALVAFALPAKADIINVGPNPTSATGHFSNDVGGELFADQITFSLSGAPVFITFASATNDFAQASDFITNFTGQLFSSGANNVPGGGDDVAAGPLVNAVSCPGTPPGCQILSGTALLGPGFYFLELEGIGGGTSGYGGNITTVGVPGPIVGAGLPGLLALFGVGGWAWRKRKVVG